MTQALSNTTLEARLRSLLRELAEEAQKFRFEVAPNPCVGAALLDGDRVVARGFHEYWGGKHAEPVALLAAKASEVGESEVDTLVVTLEPCSTMGKTAPCTDEILAAGIKRVVVGELDPDSRHRGRGLAILQEAGLEVVLLEGGARLAQFSPHFLHWNSFERIRRPRPWVIAKWAQTRSGQLIPPASVGDGRWISSEASRAEVHVLRSRVDAILTGVGTIREDDARLTVRTPVDAGPPPARVILDTELRTPSDARVLQQPTSDGERGGPTWIICRAGASPARHRELTEAGAQVVGLRIEPGKGVSLRAVVNWLWERGARRVLLESGATLLGSFLTEHFVDQLRIYTGSVNGGHGPSMASWLDPALLEARLDRDSGTDSALEAFLRTVG